MRCSRCKKAKALAWSGMCGICEIITAPKTQRFGVQTAGLVPKHFNHGLGVVVEDYDDLKKKRQVALRQGIVSNWE